MITHAGWGFWVWIVLSMMCVGPVMRMIFGSRSSYTGIAGERQGGKKSRIKRNDVDRLEAAIGERDQVIEDLQQRLSEMESRLDFAERMIASRSEVS